MKLSEQQKMMENHGYVGDLNLLYGEHELSAQRYTAACREFEKLFGGDREVAFFSAPGRTEVGGNHTDHQHGCVLAGSVNLDVIAVASPNDGGLIRIKSAGFEMDVLNITETEPVDAEEGQAIALIRGMCAAMKQNGFRIGGFDAYTTSNVLKGSGLSSSAAFEVLVGVILSHFFNQGRVESVAIAKMAQFAENVYFGKPCGLLDQMASSVGGFTAMDFSDTKNPIVEKVAFDLSAAHYHLCIVDTGGNHVNLTEDYAEITREMGAVAALFGKNVLREVEEEQFMLSLCTVREECGDRAVLRAMHFFAENRRAILEKQALEAGEFQNFLRLVNESGRSSFMYLQNVYSVRAPQEQGIPLALAVSERVLGGQGACRVHGGGFAGTIQAFVPEDLTEAYINEIEAVFGDNACHVLRIRPVGGYALTAQ